MEFSWDVLIVLPRPTLSVSESPGSDPPAGSNVTVWVMDDSLFSDILTVTSTLPMPTTKPFPLISSAALSTTASTSYTVKS